MHELSIALALVNQAESLRRKEGAQRVKGLKVRVGAWSGVHPDALKAAFPLAAEDNQGTVGALLAIEPSPVRAICRECKTAINLETHLTACDFCGSDSVEITSGRELILETITLE